MQDVALDQLIQVAESLADAAARHFHRRLWALPGEPTRMRGFAAAVVSHLRQRNNSRFASALWVSHAGVVPEPAPGDSEGLLTGVERLSAAQVLKKLGSEYPLVVFDALEGFNPDAFCAVLGTLEGGGLGILLTPPWQDWHQDADYARMVPYGYAVEAGSRYFLARFVDGLRALPTLMSAASARESVPPAPTVAAFMQQEALTQQKALLQRLLDVPARDTVVCAVTADRGRGKTALLGRAAAHWQCQARAQKKVLKIVVTAAMPAAARQVIAWCQRETQAIGGVMPADTLTFMAPDALLQAWPDAKDAGEAAPDIILIDEAAMLPVFLLQALISRFPRVVLASTVHGYEGSGRGFAVKVFPWLDRTRPGWWHLQMTTPIRWAADDALEPWLHALFCLNDALPQLPPEGKAWRVRGITGKTLYETPALLQAVFGLLVSAHYRTTPSDLRDVLDGPNLRVWLLEIGDHVAGVCLVAQEGPFADAALCEAIMAGQRRPRGHLLPQTLAFHCHSPLMLQVRCARVVRIAITPGLQGRGWGGRLLQAVEDALAAEGIEVFGTSFALEPSVLAFWRRGGMRILRIGASRESASGLPACLMAKALANARPAIQNEMEALHRQYCREAPRTLAEPLATGVLAMSTEALILAERLHEPVSDEETEHVQARVARFIAGGLPFESALGALWRAWPGVAAVIANTSFSEKIDGGLARYLQPLDALLAGKIDLAAFIALTGVSGRAGAIAVMRQIFAVLYPDPALATNTW